MLPETLVRVVGVTLNTPVHSIELIDGIRISEDTAWILVLPDASHPMIHLYGEGETTRERDAIIEVGMVKFDGRRVLERYSTLVNPGRRIPFQITQLTGISPDDVKDAPVINKVLPIVREFVGGAVIVAFALLYNDSLIRRMRAQSENTTSLISRSVAVALKQPSSEDNRACILAVRDRFSIRISPDGTSYSSVE